MKKILIISIVALFAFKLNAQTKIIMEKKGGVYLIPCKINGLDLKFIFDTGASDVSISLTEALFMLKNGHLKKEDIGEDVYYSIANGDVAKGTKLNIKEIAFAGLKLYNIQASIVHETEAPLLLGQSAISKLGKITLEGNSLTILGEKKTYNYSDFNGKSGKPINNPYEVNFSGNQNVCIFSPILDKPCMGFDEKIIGLSEKTTVEILEKYNNKYYKVKSGNLIGYLWSGWFEN